MNQNKLEQRTEEQRPMQWARKLACWFGLGCGIHVMLSGFIGAKIDLLGLGMVTMMVALYGLIGDKQ